MRVLAFLVGVSCLSSPAVAQTVTKVLDNGNDLQRLVFAVMGDGYALADQAKFTADGKRLILDGVLGHDFYGANSRAFNVYGIGLKSQDSGVSTPGVRKVTALHTTYNGDWNQCWVSEATDTQQRVIDAAQSLVKVDYYVVIVNTPMYGGCSRGNILYITAGSPFFVASHEYGHGVGRLYDEYPAGLGAFTGTFDNLNCTSFSSRAQVRWKSKIAAATPVPTTFTTGMNETTTVGAFPGCVYYDSGIFRPVQTCRMKSPDRQFCPVCLDLMKTAVQPYLPPRGSNPVPPPPSGPQRPGRQSLTGRLPMPARGVGRASSLSLQQAPPATAPPFVSLALQVQGDRIQILRATEGRGNVVKSNAAADSFYELIRNDAVVAAGPLPEGWMNQHAYAPPDQLATAHRNYAAASALLSIIIPGTSLEELSAGRTAISLAQVKSGVRLQAITTDWVATLRRNDQLTVRATLTGDAFATLLKQRIQGNRGR